MWPTSCQNTGLTECQNSRVSHTWPRVSWDIYIWNIAYRDYKFVDDDLKHLLVYWSIESWNGRSWWPLGCHTRKVLWWALRNLTVKEWAVHVILHMCHPGAKSDSRTFCTGVSWALLHTDDLVLILDTQEKCISVIKDWKVGMERRRLHVNMKKTKFLISGPGFDVLKQSDNYPCVVCHSGFGNDLIECSQCQLWVHRKRKNIIGQRVAESDYVCPRSPIELGQSTTDQWLEWRWIHTWCGGHFLPPG